MENSLRISWRILVGILFELQKEFFKNPEIIRGESIEGFLENCRRNFWIIPGGITNGIPGGFPSAILAGTPGGISSEITGGILGEFLLKPPFSNHSARTS